VPDPAPTRVIPLYVVAPPRLMMLDLAGPIDAIRRANVGQSAVRFEVIHVGPRSRVMTSVGLVVSRIAALPRSLPDDAVVLLGGNVTTLTLADDPDAGRDASDEAAIVAWLAATAAPRITSAAPSWPRSPPRRACSRTGSTSRTAAG